MERTEEAGANAADSATTHEFRYSRFVGKVLGFYRSCARLREPLRPSRGRSLTKSTKLISATIRRERGSRHSGNVDILSIRVLLVDDYQNWRHFVRSTLRKQPGLQVIGEASDGLEAVQKAQELKPDLILMDIGLPALNGIEAAGQIRERCPASQILFLSQDRSPYTAEEALRTGAGGYVVKTDAGRELLPAVQAVLQGRQFVSTSLAANGFTQDKHTADNRCREVGVEHLPRQNEGPGARHEVKFYSSDAAFVAGLAGFIEAGLQMGNVVIVVATEPHRRGILRKLKADGLDLDAAIKQGSFRSLDSVETVSTLMVNDALDPLHCAKVVGDMIVEAAKGAKRQHARVTFCGECAPILLAQGNAEAAIQLEHLWDEITKRYGADTLCAYLWSAFPDKETNPIFERICAEHSVVYS